MKRKLTVLFAALGAATLIAAPAARADEAMAKKYKGQADAVAHLSEKVKKGGSGVWGPIPMPPNTAVPDADIKALVEWILKQG